MPSGNTHRAATVLTLPPTALAAAFIAANFGQSAGPQDGLLAAGLTAAGMLATLVINPDLDLVETYLYLKVRANPLLFFLYAPWWPYGKLIPHRHWASHFPIVSTLIRLAYISILAIFLFSCALTQRPEWGELYTQDIPRNLIWWFVFGMIASDTLHYAMDKLVTKVKQVT